jgi:hypothetical protein
MSENVVLVPEFGSESVSTGTGKPLTAFTLSLGNNQEVQVSPLDEYADLNILNSARSSASISVGSQGAEAIQLGPGDSITIKHVLLSSVFIVVNGGSGALVYVWWS